jgi:hypothetical protein
MSRIETNISHDKFLIEQEQWSTHSPLHDGPEIITAKIPNNQTWIVETCAAHGFCSPGCVARSFAAKLRDRGQVKLSHYEILDGQRLQQFM